MIVYRQWKKKMYSTSPCIYNWECEGWFLFGLLPLYIRRVGVK